MKDKIAETIDTYNNIVEEYIDYFNSKDLHGNMQFQKEIDTLVKNLKMVVKFWMLVLQLEPIPNI